MKSLMNIKTFYRYRNIVYCKTSFYTTCAPVYLALLLADQRKYWTELEPLCVNLGYLFQAQVNIDFVQYYGDSYYFPHV